MDISPPSLPIPISYIASRYLLFCINTVTWLRREHCITGVLIGTIPQVPQQNVFLGLPLQLMPEEACLLVEKGLAYIVDDAKAHRNGIPKLTGEEKRGYLRALRDQGAEKAKEYEKAREEKREQALKRAKAKMENIKAKSEEAKEALVSDTNNDPDPTLRSEGQSANPTTDGDEFLFSSPSQLQIVTLPKPLPPRSIPGITPTTSHPPFPLPPILPSSLLSPPKPTSYPLYAHLHAQSYHLSPGIRFGCTYLVYPGDPLRYHSHFLAEWVGWEEEMGLMEIVGGGRLGGGVKKGWLIGGKGKQKEGKGNGDEVRVFSVEWAGM